MKPFSFSRGSRAIGFAGIVATAFSCVAAGSAVAAPTTPAPPAPAAGPATPAGANLNQYSEANLYWGDTSQCEPPTVDQPFLSWNDSNDYTLVPGQDQNGFTGQGWTLADGASIKSEAAQNGAAAEVLDLPSGSVAVSPAMCVSSAFPTARTMVRNVVGAEGVQVYVAYAGQKTEDQPKSVGQVHGQQTSWTLSNPFNVQPGNASGWELVRFTFVPGGKTSDFQIYNFYVDPRASW
jgi:hypothetical protein